MLCARVDRLPGGFFNRAAELLRNNLRGKYHASRQFEF